MWPLKRKRSWLLLVCTVVLSCGNDDPHQGSHEGGSSGTEAGGAGFAGSIGGDRTETGGAQAGEAGSSGFGGSTGGDGTETGGTESGGTGNGGSMGSYGGDGTIVPCQAGMPSIAGFGGGAGVAGAVGVAGSGGQGSWPDGSPCGGPLYCMADGGRRTCVCTSLGQGGLSDVPRWLCWPNP